MNPDKREYNGWILCPSTRFLGKFYYFNPATGEAVWNLNDMERRMVSQPNFTNNKWHTYPEPDSPPEETSNPWGYQPGYRMFPQASPTFCQAEFPKYTPNFMEMFPPSMPWGLPQSMYMPMMNMPPYNPMSQTWPNFRHNPKHYMQEKCSFPNPYMQKAPNFGQGINRQVFGPKPRQNAPAFQQMNNQNKEMMNKRLHSTTDYGIDKEPQVKRSRSQIDLQNENIFGRLKENTHQTVSFDSLVPEKRTNPYKMPLFQPIDTPHVCECQRSKSQGNLSTQFSKSHENLTNIGKSEPVFKPTTLTRPRSLESLISPPTEISSNFSLESSFVFPLNKSDSKVSSTKISSPKKKVQNSTVSQSGQDNKKQSESSDSKLSETDLRYILMARRKKPSVTEMERNETGHTEPKKIKTSYTKDNKLGESSSKKRVTFNLGVEDSVVSDDQEADIPRASENVEDAEVYDDQVAKVCYVVADIDVLLTEFELIEEFVKSDEAYILLVPECVQRDIETLCGGLGGGARRRVLAARHIARRLRGGHHHIQVQPDDPKQAAETDDPALNCCLRVYDEGYNSILITNNSDLYSKAISYEIDCYTMDDIKQHMSNPKPEVSFDVKRIDNTEIDVITNPQKIFDENQNFQSKRQITVNKQNPFLEKDFFNKIENLNLEEKIDFQINREALAVEKHLIKKENSFVFKNDNVSKESNLTAKKLNQKPKNINIYNLEGLLKTYSIKSKEMEERIRIRMDEYVCVFCQIMEAILFNILKDWQSPPEEDLSKPPLHSLLHSALVAFDDLRTAQVLVDKLIAVLDCAFVRDTDTGRLVLDLNPNGFVKMLASGILLVKVLRNTRLSDPSLEEGEALLEQLERSVEEWETEPEPNIVPTTPAAGLEPRPGFVKNPLEVLQYLTKHFTEWQSLKTAKNNEQTVDSSNKTEVTEKPTTKVIRTFGRNLGLLKLGPGNPLNFSTNKENADKENDSQDNNTENLEAKKKDTKEISKPKIIKKLALESLNLPPKFKEIDVEKREKDNEELTKMLDEIVQPKPLTKFYDLKSVIVNTDDENKNKVDSSKVNDKINLKIDIKEINYLKRNINNNNNSITNKLQTRNIVKNEKPKIINNDQKITNSAKVNKITFDLDALDYSDIGESIIEDKAESMINNYSSNKEIIESDNCNDVTTTHNSNEQNEATPNTDKDNETANDNSDDANENSDNVNENEVLNIACSNNDDSGIESNQAYCLAQLFLVNLSKTLIAIKNFIESSLIHLKHGVSEDYLEYLYQKTVELYSLINRIIKNLMSIMDRESNPDTALSPLLMKGAPEVDMRMVKYSRIMSKCVTSARVLQRSLLILQRISRRDLALTDLSDATGDYDNLFE